MSFINHFSIFLTIKEYTYTKEKIILEYKKKPQVGEPEVSLDWGIIFEYLDDVIN